MLSHLKIIFNRQFELIFAIEDTPLARLWQHKMDQRHQWPLDDPARFYGFNNIAAETAIAEQHLKTCIQTINSYQPIIEKSVTDVYDQDLLNYLHNIFDQYHGSLDQQNTEWWHAAPPSVRKALADLNIAVHRAENITRGNYPRFVCTWFGMPKHEQLSREIIETHGRSCYEFGGVYINYVEIGKTVEDLSMDDDHWISDDSFRPFLHYSADFNVRFYDKEIDHDRVKKYYEQNRGWFESRGIFSADDYRARPRRFKVAGLDSYHSREHILNEISNNQLITDIYLL